MNSPLVSIIIPCFNGETYLEEFLASLFMQDYPRVEVLFADDGSADHTAEIFHAYESGLPEGWTSQYLLQEHSGQAAAVSMALKLVTGDFLMWSDADDIMLPGSISRKARFLTENPQYNMVRNDFYFFYANADPPHLAIGYGKNKSKGEDIFEGIFNSTMPCLAGTYMMRSELMFSCYPDKSVPLSEEGQNFQLLLPAASRSRCGFIDEPLMKYRIHEDSHSNRPRSVTQQLSRAEGFLKLRKMLLDYCECDREYYEKLAAEIYETQKKEIILNTVARARNEMKAQKQGK